MISGSCGEAKKKQPSSRFWFTRMDHNYITHTKCRTTPLRFNKQKKSQTTDISQRHTFYLHKLQWLAYRQNTGNWAPITISLHPFSPRNAVVWLKHNCLLLVRQWNVCKVVLDGKHWPCWCEIQSLEGVLREGDDATDAGGATSSTSSSTIISFMSHPSYFTNISINILIMPTHWPSTPQILA